MPQRIAIIGAGPIGIEAALYARTLGYEVAVYDRGGPAHNVRAWGFVNLFTPWRMNVTPLGARTLNDDELLSGPLADVCPSGNALADRYLTPLVESDLLKGVIHAQQQVLSVGRDDFIKSDEIGTGRRTDSPFRLLIRDADGDESVRHAEFVLDCSGVYQHHRWAGRGGIPAPGERSLAGEVWYTVPDILGRDRARFADRHTLLLGCGHSAATALFNLERLNRDHPGTRVSWAIRRAGQALSALNDDALPARRQLVQASMRLADSPPPWLQFLGKCTLERIEKSDVFAVSLRYGQTDLALTADEIVALVGYAPDSSLYEQLQVHQCYATAGPMKLAAALLGESSADCLTAGANVDAGTLSNPEPGFFILGAKSYGTNSNFLLHAGHRQVRDVYRLITGQALLDLYEQADVVICRS